METGGFIMTYIISCKELLDDGHSYEIKYKENKTYFTEVGKPTEDREESGLFYNINDAILACNILNEVVEHLYYNNKYTYVVEVYKEEVYEE